MLTKMGYFSQFLKRLVKGLFYYVHLSQNFRPIVTEWLTENIYPDAVKHDRMRLIDLESGQLVPIHHCYLKRHSEKTNF